MQQTSIREFATAERRVWLTIYVLCTRHARHRPSRLSHLHDAGRACAQRTAASIPLEAIVIDHADVPVYVSITDKAKQLRELGMSNRAIARVLGVSDKTVTRSLVGAPETTERFRRAGR